MIKEILNLMLIASICACAPVRSKYFKESEKNSVIGADSALAFSAPESIKDMRRYFSRFSDTAHIELTPYESISSLSLAEQFALASQDFDSGDYDKACRKFKDMASTVTNDDSLYFESKFLLSECDIIHGDFESAEIILSEILVNPFIPHSTIEKTMVRLGQIYCITDRKELASKIFSQLKDKYPNSIYLKVADCSAIESEASE
jgi:TolA-binding protein